MPTKSFHGIIPNMDMNSLNPKPNRPRHAQTGLDMPRQAQTYPDRPRHAQAGPDSPYQAQTGLAKPRQALPSPERGREDKINIEIYE